MNFHPRRNNEDLEISLVPLIDVVFLLLVFFMVTTTFSHYSEITINLPEAAATEVDRERTTIDLVVDVQGRYYVNDRLLVNTQIGTLKNALAQVIEGRKNTLLLISADAQTPHQAVITAMDAARQSGIVHVSLATREPED